MHETNGYSARPTPLSDFDTWDGDAIGAWFSEPSTYVGGMLEAARSLPVQVVPCYVAEAEPSGPILHSAYEEMRATLLDAMARALPLDGIALALHGAAQTDRIDDVESDLCRAIRTVVGPGIPIVATFDLHGNVNQELARHLDLMLGVKEYPHIDKGDKGNAVMRALVDMLRGRLRPQTWVERLPMLLPPTQTFQGPMVDVNRMCRELEAAEGMVDVTVFHGFPYADSPQVGTAVVATAKGNRTDARRNARLVASYLWSRRAELRPKSLTADEAVEQAVAMDGGPIIVNETSDNPGLGTPGDGTHLLKAMLDADLRDAAFAFVVDPAVAAQAHTAGVGATIDVELGAKVDWFHGEPLRVRAYVKALTDGRFTLRHYTASQGNDRDLGLMARLSIGAVDVLVGSRHSQVHDPEIFAFHGIDIRHRKIVGIKSSHHFRAGFAHVAAGIVTADPPGIGTFQVERLPRKTSGRKLWPIDPDAVYPGR